jgi:A/G-specific adenine glycosylase
LDITSALLDWYDRNRRELPWRGSRDPYLIWVSEIIFQQTRIGQGTSYYLRFTGRFPNLRSLADANEDEVLRIWQGLGYYSRARNMLFTARYIRDELDGRFPSDFEGILALRGIGDYTASCIASICFGQVHAAVDGNVYRVLSRLNAESTPIDTPAGRKRFKELAGTLISHDRPGDFNEAMMDLGATVCQPRAPKCGECPLKGGCLAFELGKPADYPVKSQAMRKGRSIMNYLLVESGDRLYIRKRDGEGIWKGLYELPRIDGEQDPDSLAGECHQYYGLKIEPPEEILRVKHILSHRDLDIRFYKAKTGNLNPLPVCDLIPVAGTDISSYPFPKPLVDFLKSQGKG